MNIVVLAGGFAERLWPLTERFPKALLQLPGGSILEHLAANVSRISGINSMTICIDAPQEKLFEAEAANLASPQGMQWNVARHPVKGSTPLGPVTKLRDLWLERRLYDLRAEETLVLGADNVFGFPLPEFLTFCRKKRSSGEVVAVQKLESQIDASEFGAPEVRASGVLSNMVEKPQDTEVDLISTACYFLTPDSMEAADTYLTQGLEDNLGRFIGWLAHKRQVLSYQFTEEWYDTGSREGLLNANALLLKDATSGSPSIVHGALRRLGSVFCAPGVEVQDSILGPNAFIGAEARIENSTVSNSIVYEGAIIRNSHVVNTVVGPSSVIEGSLDALVTGPGTRVLAEERSQR